MCRWIFLTTPGLISPWRGTEVVCCPQGQPHFSWIPASLSLWQPRVSSAATTSRFAIGFMQAPRARSWFGRFETIADSTPSAWATCRQSPRRGSLRVPGRQLVNWVATSSTALRRTLASSAPAATGAFSPASTAANWLRLPAVASASARRSARPSPEARAVPGPRRVEGVRAPRPWPPPMRASLFRGQFLGFLQAPKDRRSDGALRVRLQDR